MIQEGDTYLSKYHAIQLSNLHTAIRDFPANLAP